MEGRGIILLSGGMDSTTMLYQYEKNIDICLSFKVPTSQSEKELRWARYHTKQLNKEHIILETDVLQQLESSLLQDSDIDVPTEDVESLDNLKKTSIPYRNGIYISIATSIAESRGLDWVGISTVGLYPDCTPKFNKYQSLAMTNGTYNEIKLFYPYSGTSKTHIVEQGLRLGINYRTTYSCYKGTWPECGECVTCKEKKEALKEASDSLSRHFPPL